MQSVSSTGGRGRPQTASWHALTESEVLGQLGSSLRGLSEDEVVARRQTYGPNVLPTREPPTALAILIHQVKSPLIYILLVAGAVSILIGDAKDAIFIFAVVALNAILGAFQEWRAERSAAALQRLLTIAARVRRATGEGQIAADELVPGDLVLLESGSRVPADLRLLQVNNLSIDESLLTGESLAVDKRCALLGPEAPISERANMAFAGSTVASGRGLGVVVATGLRSEVGAIARAVSASEATRPPLVIRMERFAQQISLVVLGAILLLATVALTRGVPYAEVFFLAVALAVSAIPEGLPVALTVALSIATNRMARRNVIVRKLTAVEGLGSCTYIASDKTGTLTVNQQTARMIVLPDGERLEVTGEGYSGVGEVVPAGGGVFVEHMRERLALLARAAALCNEGELQHDREGWRHRGDAVDIALLALAHKLRHEPAALREQVCVRAELPFESERCYAATCYEQGGRVEVALKGALERVLPFCTTMLGEEGPEALDQASIEQEALDLASQGYRVIALAGGEAEASLEAGDFGEEAIPPLTLLGLVGLIDPLRPEARAAVARCRAAGIVVAMVTGDHPATARAIAHDLGIIDNHKQVITGTELDALGPPEAPALLDAVASARVFARVTPLQKLQIVETLRRLGHFVAVTGDGVNDAPALRAASIGVAMGSGTDIAKDTAALIVTDDNFASIEAGVEEGRSAYANVRKVTYLLISTGAAEIVIFTLALIAGLPLPLFAVQLLWLNLVTNGIQGVALAFEQGEPETMSRPPRAPTESIFNPLMIRQTLISAMVMVVMSLGLWAWLLNAGWEEEAARNLLLLLLVLLQNVHIFNCRSEYTSAFRVPLRRNRLLMAGIAGALGLHLLAMQIPFMQSVLGVAPVSPVTFGVLLLLALSVLVVMELDKLARGRRDGRRLPEPA